MLISLQGFGQTMNDSLTISLLTNVVQTLAHDSFNGRETGTEYEKKSLDFISETIRSLTQKKLKKQGFEFLLDSARCASENGYYFLNKRKKETVIIGAHYDHIGLGGPLSMSRKNNQIHNGADDNASGVAMLIALMNQLVHEKSLNYNFLFVFYGAHEEGLFGSSAFQKLVEKKKLKFKNIALVINLDMVGRYNPNLKKLKCMRNQFSEKFFENSRPDKFDLELNFVEEEKLVYLDTKEHYLKNTPCINFTTGLHTDYHSVSDDSQYINFPGMLLIYSFLYQFAVHLK